MENLNDLIRADEEDNGSNDIQPQNERMHEVCMIAFCGVVRGGGSGGGYDTAASDFACSRDWSTGPNPCA